jgi:hypothetical protein
LSMNLFIITGVREHHCLFIGHKCIQMHHLSWIRSEVFLFGAG